MLSSNGIRKGYLKGPRSYRSVFFIFIAICLLIAVVCEQYYTRLNDTIRDESKNYLQEVSRRVATNIDSVIADNYAALNTIVVSLAGMEQPTLAEAKALLKKQQAFWSYESVMLVDNNGSAYTLDNQEIFLSLEDTVRKELLGGRQAMATAQVINNRDRILFLVPLQGVVIEGREMFALAGSYDPTSFDQLLSMTSFNNLAYSQIISKSGAIVIRSSSEHASKTGYNIYSTLQAAELDKGYSLEQIRSEINANLGDQISFRLNDEHWYMVYTPIQPDDWYLLTFVPSKVVNEKSSALLGVTLIISGLITLAFAALTATLILMFNSHRRKLEQIAYVDDVTGGNTITRFYDHAQVIMKAFTSTRFALIYTNIEKFKLLNEQLGRQNCDMLLRYFYEFLQEDLAEHECMGRLSADNFCILVEYTSDDAMVERLGRWLKKAEVMSNTPDMPWSLPVTGYGIYVVQGELLDFPQMIDRAKLALKESTWNIENKIHYAFYNDGMRKRLIREKQLEDRMEHALRHNEFKVHLQPKYRLPDEFINGAEALVRWQTKSEGMIFPDEFIPLFEKNGFIVQVDLFVFEQVCITIRSWTERGLAPLRISVNCSCIHFKNPKFLAPYIMIADRYGIDKNLIEIELTESVVLERGEQLLQIIDDIKGAGFGCSMDDFGSGYSSLNLLQTIPVDTLKIDKIFFRNHDTDAERTEAVVKNIILMSKELKMETVAEGVEHREQVEMLKRAGCDYIQGYVFAKPMPIEDFEKRAFGI